MANGGIYKNRVNRQPKKNRTRETYGLQRRATWKKREGKRRRFLDVCETGKRRKVERIIIKGSGIAFLSYHRRLEEAAAIGI